MDASNPITDVRIIEQPVRMFDFEPFPTAGGGECIFLGRTRLEVHAEFGRLLSLRYEAYREMAERVLNDLAKLSIERFGCIAVRIHHAIGEVKCGEASVLVQVVCGHRDKAFDACRFLIDRLKTNAPIWKREQWERGESWSKSGLQPGSQQELVQ